MAGMEGNTPMKKLYDEEKFREMPTKELRECIQQDKDTSRTQRAQKVLSERGDSPGGGGQRVDEGEVRQGGGQRGMREEGGQSHGNAGFGDERTGQQGDAGQRGFGEQAGRTPQKGVGNQADREDRDR